MAPPYRRFLISSAPRSGTHMLRTTLDGHPHIVCLAESFNPDLVGGEPYDLDTPSAVVLDRHVFCERPPEIGAVGFALHRNGAPIGNWADVWPLLERDRELNVILLHRHHLLRRFLSYCLMRERNRSGSPDYRPQPRRYEPAVLQADFEKQERDLAAFRERFREHPILQVSYEELCDRRAVTLLRLQRFLGVSPRDSSPRTERNASPPIDWLIENLDELAEWFRPTRWAWFFRPEPSSAGAPAAPAALGARASFSLRSGPSPAPDFVIAGTRHCGVAALAALLGRHPAISLPGSEREPGDRERGDAPERRRTRSGVAIEGSDRAVLGPATRLLFVIRDPFDRIDDAYRQLHHASTGGILVPFGLERALAFEPSLLLDSRYHEDLGRYRESVGSDRILVVALEELCADPDRVVRQCCEHLDVDGDPARGSLGSADGEGVEVRLYDTQRLRALRRPTLDPDTTISLAELDPTMLDPLLEKAGLRKRFTDEPLPWSAVAEERVVSELGGALSELLESLDRRISVWPRFAAALGRTRGQRARMSGESASGVVPAGVDVHDHGFGNRIELSGRRGLAPTEERRAAGRLVVNFLGDQNTLAMAGPVNTESDGEVRIAGNRNQVVLAEDLVLPRGSLLCIDGHGNRVSLAGRVGHPISVFVETDDGRHELAAGDGLLGRGTLVIGRPGNVAWRSADPAQGAATAPPDS